jgi:hypothetical protein
MDVRNSPVDFKNINCYVVERSVRYRMAGGQKRLE